jgi:hypothetical protein
MGDKQQSGSQSSTSGPGQTTSKPKPITWSQKDASGGKKR